MSLEEQLIDATTEEGQKRLKEMEAEAAAGHDEAAAEQEGTARTDSKYADDPE